MLYEIIVSNLSSKLLSKLGSFTDVAITAISMLAIEGLINEFLRGFISSKYLFISSIITVSPTNGVMPSCLNFPLGLQTYIPFFVLTV